ncbi:xylose isomerase [Salinarchaeum sp. Harcht-Bsk1]|uniref:sugar phosphate isomerase/epimerase family protein n=1 Tax=Salinarchaeum sp. Harcht-Bsk1 TaxID=1333523 RepID=UPI00034241D0|nr:sugar phosphate isomerase/epimerase [Salinarchaeum sp. Harcht-Bsk1]AGN00076.1 xylose isomerase [Salinarchaeum sp. Harcht-Bsk1]
MAKTAIQLYTLRDVDLPFDELLEAVADAGFDGVEFAYRVPDEDPEEVRAVLDETGLEAAGAHVHLEDLEDDFEDTVAFYETLGVENFVIPWLDEEYFTSREGLDEAIERLSAVADDLAEEGYTLHYHNHDQEYSDYDGEPGFYTFIDESDFGLELDLGFVLIGGDDPAGRLRAVGDRCSLAHVKDVDADAGHSVPVGDGDVDIDAAAEAFAEIDGEWLIYEYEGDDPLESLDDAAATMRDLV